MNEPINYTTSGGSELIKSGPGMLHGYILTSGSPLSSSATPDCRIAFHDRTTGTGLTSNNMLAHGRVTTGGTIHWEPSWLHVFTSGLWLQVYSGSPVVTTSWF